MTDRALYDITEQEYVRTPFEKIQRIIIETASGKGKRKSFCLNFMDTKPHYHSTVKASDTYRINIIMEIVRESLNKSKPVKIEYTKDFTN